MVLRRRPKTRREWKADIVEHQCDEEPNLSLRLVLGIMDISK